MRSACFRVLFCLADRVVGSLSKPKRHQSGRAGGTTPHIGSQETSLSQKCRVLFRCGLGLNGVASFLFCVGQRKASVFLDQVLVCLVLTQCKVELFAIGSNESLDGRRTATLREAWSKYCRQEWRLSESHRGRFDLSPAMVSISAVSLDYTEAGRTSVPKRGETAVVLPFGDFSN